MLCVSLRAGKGSWEVAGEMVRAWMHKLLQILIQKWCVELWGAHVGSLLLWPKTIQGIINNDDKSLTRTVVV